MSQAILPMTSPESAPVPLIDLVEQFETQRDEILEAVERVFSKQAFILGDEVAALEEEIEPIPIRDLPLAAPREPTR